MSDPPPSSSGPTPAPGGLRPEEVSLLVQEMAEELQGARVEKVYDLGPLAFLLRLRGVSGRRDLRISVRPGFTRFHFTFDPESLPAAPSEVAKSLRELLRNGRVLKLDQPGGDRILRIDLEVPRDGRRLQRSLVLELFGPRGRLLVYEGSERIVRFLHGRRGIELGSPYRFAPPPSRSRDRIVLPFDPRQLIPEELAEESCPFHRALGARMSDAERAADRAEVRERLLVHLKRERKRIRRLLAKQEEAARVADRWEEQQRSGELLKGELGKLRRGLSRVEVVDYFDPDLPTKEILLDPGKTPTENIELYFKRARKGKRSVEAVEERRQWCVEDLEQLDTAETMLAVDEEASEEVDVAGVEKLLARLHHAKRSRRPGPGRKKRGPVRRETGPRKFRTREGLDVLAGRSAKENDRLTLHTARGNDLFFHMAHRPGPHVILRVPRGKNPSPESIDDAAYLAAYLSGWRGPGDARVTWTEAKYIRKPKGAPAGTVLLSRDREHRVTFQDGRLERLVVERPESENP